MQHTPNPSGPADEPRGIELDDLADAGAAVEGLQLLSPPTSGASTEPEDHGTATTKPLTRLNGLALVISLQIGSGIFTVPSQVAQFVPGPGWGLAAWLLAGLLVWTGAASFVELGLRMPTNGGVQEYLRACYGEWMGFLFGWAWCLVAKPAANALIAGIAAGYLGGAWAVVAVAAAGGGGGGGDGAPVPPPPPPPPPPWVTTLLALLCVAAITFLNCLTPTSGARAANVFLFLKLGALAAVVLVGVSVWLLGTGEGVPLALNGWGDLPSEDGAVGGDGGLWAWAGNFATALFGALFCYGGWETAGFVLGDMKDPEGDLPVVINGAMATVVTGFCLMNAALFVVLPMDVIRASKTVAVEFARRTLGTWVALLFSLVVAVSALGALNANVFATAKIAVTASRRGYFPAMLANKHCVSAKDEAAHLTRSLSPFPGVVRAVLLRFAAWTRKRRWHASVPVFALVCNSTMTCIYVVAGSFNGLVTLIGLVEYTLFMLSVVGLLVIRRNEAMHHRNLQTGSTTTHSHVLFSKYRTSILNPLVFSVVSCLLVLRGVLTDPLQGLAVTAVAAVGMAVFVLRFGSRGLSMGPGPS